MAADAGDLSPHPAERMLREGLRVVLVRPEQPGNVGSCARAMKNMGLRQMVIVDPPVLDLERARWMATGASDLLASARWAPSVADAVADCDWVVALSARSRRWSWPVLTPGALAREAFDRGGRIALIFGPESEGLSNDDLSHCQALVQIPTDGLASLNLSQAVLLISACLFDEACARGWRSDEPPRQGRRSGGAGEEGRVSRPPRAAEAAPVGAREEVAEMALQVLAQTPYMDSRSREQIQVFLSGLLHRAEPTQDELNIIKGMLKKLSWSLGAKGA